MITFLRIVNLKKKQQNLHFIFDLLTFALKAFFSQDADQGQELGDFFQIQHSGVVEFDDGHGLLVIGTAATILPQTEGQHSERAKAG